MPFARWQTFVSGSFGCVVLAVLPIMEWWFDPTNWPCSVTLSHLVTAVFAIHTLPICLSLTLTLFLVLQFIAHRCEWATIVVVVLLIKRVVERPAVQVPLPSLSISHLDDQYTTNQSTILCSSAAAAVASDAGFVVLDQTHCFGLLVGCAIKAT